MLEDEDGITIDHPADIAGSIAGAGEIDDMEVGAAGRPMIGGGGCELTELLVRVGRLIGDIILIEDDVRVDLKCGLDHIDNPGFAVGVEIDVCSSIDLHYQGPTGSGVGMGIISRGVEKKAMAERIVFDQLGPEFLVDEVM